MKVYIVSSFDSRWDNCETSIVEIFTDLEKANDYTKRCIGDSWRTHYGYEYKTTIRSDGTVSVKHETELSENGYCVNVYEVTE